MKIKEYETRTDMTDDTFETYFWHGENELVFDCPMNLSISETRQLAGFLNKAADVLYEYINDKPETTVKTSVLCPDCGWS